MEIRVIASIVAKTEFIEEVKAALHQIIEPSREEKGIFNMISIPKASKKGLLSFSNAGLPMKHWKSTIKQSILSNWLRPLMANWKVWRLKK